MPGRSPRSKNLSRYGRRRSRSTSATRLAAARERDREVRDRRRLALLLDRARDHDRPHRAVEHAELDVRAQHAERLGLEARRLLEHRRACPCARRCFGGSGTRPSSGRLSRSPISCALRTRVSSVSRRKARPRPSTIPRKSPRTAFRVGRGATCVGRLRRLDDRRVRRLQRLHRLQLLLALDEAMCTAHPCRRPARRAAESARRPRGARSRTRCVERVPVDRRSSRRTPLTSRSAQASDRCCGTRSRGVRVRGLATRTSSQRNCCGVIVRSPSCAIVPARDRRRRGRPPPASATSVWCCCAVGFWAFVSWSARSWRESSTFADALVDAASRATNRAAPRAARG